jgi:hypothetical protein
MIETAIRKSFGMPARAARSRVRSGFIAVRSRRVARPARFAGSVLLFDVRRALTAFLLVAFVLGSAVCSPAAHHWLDADQPDSAQPMSENAKSSGGDEAPAKGNLAGLCTGHCTSHSVALPAVFIATAVPFLRQAAWRVANDQWAQASAPARLERPPRV